MVGFKSEYYEAEDRDSEKSFLKDGRGAIYPNDETLKGNLEKFFPFQECFLKKYYLHFKKNLLKKEKAKK